MRAWGSRFTGSVPAHDSADFSAPLEAAVEQGSEKAACRADSAPAAAGTGAVASAVVGREGAGVCGSCLSALQSKSQRHNGGSAPGLVPVLLSAVSCRM